MMANGVEHLLMYLVVSCKYSLEKCVSRSFAYFLIGLFVFLLLNCKYSLCGVDVSPLLGIFCKYFFILCVSLLHSGLYILKHLFNFDEV